MGVHFRFCVFWRLYFIWGKVFLRRTNTEIKNVCSFRHGPRGPRITPGQNCQVDPAYRWNLVGSKRYTQLKTIEDERRAYELKMKPTWDAEKAAAKEAANRASMLQLAAEAGVKVSADF